MAEVDPRVNGSEMEWAVMAHDVSNENRLVMLESGALNVRLRAYNKLVRGYDKIQNQYLDNGARLYVDVGHHLEYATPETTSFTEAVAAEIAGEKVVWDCLNMSTTEKAGQPHYQGLRQHKRVADREGNTSGYHENYQASAAKVPIKPDKLMLVAAHVVTRQVLFGAGFLSMKGDFQLSQKATTVRQTFASGTMSEKPIIVLREEALADKEWSRVQVVGGDPNMSPWAMRMRLATTRIVLRLQEHDMEVPGVDLISPVQAMHQINGSLGQGKFELSDGSMTNAVNVQRQFIEAGKSLAAQGLLEDQEMEALDEWEKAIADFCQDPALLYDRADWVLRYKMLRAQQQKHGCSWDSMKLRDIDLTWDVIGKGGIAEKLRQTIWARHMPDEHLIERLKQQAPEKTRAHARSRFLQAFGGPDSNTSVAWDAVSVENTRIPLPDPRQSYYPRLENMIRTHPQSREVAA